VKKLKKILIVDDDKNVCEYLRRNFEKEGFKVIISNNGNEAMIKFHALRPEMVMLDVLLTGMDGWQVCREIRKISRIPIIFITSKSDIFDMMLGFEIGADDYILKPFDVREVIARVRAIQRRIAVEKPKFTTKEIFYENIHINLTDYTVKINGDVVDIPPKEIELLYYMASNPNRVFTRDQLLDSVWGVDFYGETRTVDVHIKKLRQKLEGASDKWNLTTVWGVGYKFQIL